MIWMAGARPPDRSRRASTCGAEQEQVRQVAQMQQVEVEAGARSPGQAGNEVNRDGPAAQQGHCWVGLLLLGLRPNVRF